MDTNARPSPDSPQVEKERYLRALYRQHRPRATWRNDKLILDQAQQRRQWEIVSAEYVRLYGQPSVGGALEHILRTAWVEQRELVGQRYDYTYQHWVDRNGKRVE